MALDVPAGVASAVYELETRERRFRAVFESALDAIVIFDDSGRVLEANRAAAALFGVAPQALPGRNLDEFCSALNDGRSVLADVRSAGRLRRELEILRPDGERRVVESSITADFVLGQHVGVLCDVTDHRNHERERLHLAERFERLFRTDLVGMALINRQTGILEDCNHKLAEFFGRAAEDFVGRRVSDFADFFPSRERYERLLAAWASGARLRGVPIESALPDGTKRQGLATFESLPDMDGQRSVDVAVVVDVTEQHRLEAELRQAQRLEAIGRLAGGIAHEFNNLLAVIGGFAALLEATVANDPDARDSVDEIKRATNRAVKLVYGLLAFSKQEPFEVRDIDIHALIRRSVGGLQELFGPQVVVELRLEAPNPWVRTDGLQLEHALQQLASNARDAMPNGGTFIIETSAGPNEFRLSLRDTGTGMDPITLERAFEPFFTTKPIGANTGLGLSTVYGIVTRSGGRIIAQSAPMRGTTVDVFLPAIDPAPAPEPAPDALPATKPIVGTETILLVEEETSVALLIESFLSRLGYRVIHASSQADALKTAESFGDHLDLAISNIRLADGTGSSLVDELRQTQEMIPVVLVSGSQLTSADALPLRPNTILLTKPFAMADLATAARNLLDRA